MKQIILTDEQASRLGFYLETEKYARMNRIEAYEKIAKETNEDGSPKYPRMACNARFLNETEKVLDEVVEAIGKAQQVEG